MQKSLKEKTILVDTSVLVEYVIEDSPYLEKIETILNEGIRTKRLATIPQVLSETLYVVSKLYSYAKINEANKKAIDYLRWISNLLEILSIDGLALHAGEIRKLYRISLTDCYLIAAAKKTERIALFLKPEKEMKKHIDELKRFGVMFLSEM